MEIAHAPFETLAHLVMDLAEACPAQVELRQRPLGEIMQSNRKIVRAWAIEGDFDPKTLKSNLFEIEWPPKSGKIQLIPEVDRAEWFTLRDARKKS